MFSLTKVLPKTMEKKFGFVSGNLITILRFTWRSLEAESCSTFFGKSKMSNKLIDCFFIFARPIQLKFIST